MSMTVLLSWKPMRRLPTLCGFASVRYGDSLKISDISVHSGGGKRWVNFPGKAHINGTTVALDARGKVKHSKIVEFLDDDAAEEFACAVIAAVERESPGSTSASE